MATWMLRAVLPTSSLHGFCPPELSDTETEFLGSCHISVQNSLILPGTTLVNEAIEVFASVATLAVRLVSLPPLTGAWRSASHQAIVQGLRDCGLLLQPLLQGPDPIAAPLNLPGFVPLSVRYGNQHFNIARKLHRLFRKTGLYLALTLQKAHTVDEVLHGLQFPADGVPPVTPLPHDLGHQLLISSGLGFFELEDLQSMALASRRARVLWAGEAHYRSKLSLLLSLAHLQGSMGILCVYLERIWPVSRALFLLAEFTDYRIETGLQAQVDGWALGPFLATL